MGIAVKQKDNVYVNLKLKKLNDEIIPLSRPPVAVYSTITHLQASFDENIIM